MILSTHFLLIIYFTCTLIVLVSVLNRRTVLCTVLFFFFSTYRTNGIITLSCSMLTCAVSLFFHTGKVSWSADQLISCGLWAVQNILLRSVMCTSSHSSQSHAALVIILTILYVFSLLSERSVLATLLGTTECLHPSAVTPLPPLAHFRTYCDLTPQTLCPVLVDDTFKIIHCQLTNLIKIFFFSTRWRKV